MSIDYTMLKAERKEDPKKLGYLKAGSDAAEAVLFNRIDSNSEYIQVLTLTRGQVLLSIAPAYLSLPALSAEIQNKWDRILASIRSADYLDLTSPVIKMLMATSIEDKVLTDEQVDAIGKRLGTRAEVLFGEGTVVTAADIEYSRLRA